MRECNDSLFQRKSDTWEVQSVPMRRWLKPAERFDIQKYKPPRDPERLHRTHVAFSGSLFKHPHDERLVLLVTDPGSSNTSWFEFRIEDVSFFEDLPSIVGPEGDVLSLVRIWVKKMSVGVRYTPFLVEDVSSRGNA